MAPYYANINTLTAESKHFFTIYVCLGNFPSLPWTNPSPLLILYLQLFESLFQLDLPTALAAAKAYAKSGAAAKKAKAAAVAVAARGGDPVEPPAVALKVQ